MSRFMHQFKIGDLVVWRVSPPQNYGEIRDLNYANDHVRVAWVSGSTQSIPAELLKRASPLLLLALQAE